MKTHSFFTLSSLLVAMVASVSNAEKLGPQTEIFAHRGIKIRMMDLPDRKISCRIYLAERDRRGLNNLRAQFTGIKRLSRLELTTQFSQDFSAADVRAQSEQYLFGDRMFRDTPQVPHADSYDGLRALDPDKSTDPVYGPLARRYRKFSKPSDLIEMFNLQATLANISPVPSEKKEAMYAGVHIFDRHSDPKFYMRITDHASAEEDEWGVSLWGEQKNIRPLIPPLFQSPLKDGMMVLGGPIWPTIFLYKNALTDQDPTILLGGYCFPGGQGELEANDRDVRDVRLRRSNSEFKLR